MYCVIPRDKQILGIERKVRNKRGSPDSQEIGTQDNPSKKCKKVKAVGLQRARQTVPTSKDKTRAAPQFTETDG